MIGDFEPRRQAGSIGFNRSRPRRAFVDFAVPKLKTEVRELPDASPPATAEYVAACYFLSLWVRWCCDIFRIKPSEPEASTPRSSRRDTLADRIFRVALTRQRHTIRNSGLGGSLRDECFSPSRVQLPQG